MNEKNISKWLDRKPVGRRGFPGAKGEPGQGSELENYLQVINKGAANEYLRCTLPFGCDQEVSAWTDNGHLPPDIWESMPYASAGTKGAIKVGTGLTISNGVLSATGGGGGDSPEVNPNLALRKDIEAWAQVSFGTDEDGDYIRYRCHALHQQGNAFPSTTFIDGKRYTLSFIAKSELGSLYFRFYYKDGSYDSITINSRTPKYGSLTSAVGKNVDYVKITYGHDDYAYLYGYKIEAGETATDFIPAMEDFLQGYPPAGVPVSTGSSWGTPITKITQNGNNIGIGKSGTEALDVNGNIKASGNIKAIGEVEAYYSSDKRLKREIKNFSALGIINKLNPITFKWNKKAKKLNKSKDDRLNYGFIAQELREVCPELIKDIYDKYLGIDYIQIISILVQANKELFLIVNELQNELKKLRDGN